MISRRDWLGTSLGAGAALALTPELLRALHALEQPGGKLIQRAIPSTGEMLPVIALGFANHAGCADPAALKEVLKTFVDNGGRVFDTQHGNNPKAQGVTASVVTELGVQKKLFLSLRGIAGDGRPGPKLAPDAEKAHFEGLLSSLNVSKADLVVGFPDTDPTYWSLLKEAKKAGRIRYLGTAVTSFGDYSRFEAIMRNEPLDFITVDYCIDRRGAEEKLLPLALERKIAVLSFFPFGGADGQSCVSEKGLFQRVGNAPLPAWAAEFDAKTWAQFFLKYVISHPAITTVRVGTTKAHHMLDNIGGGIGRLPNEATRKRMAELIESFPLPVAPLLLERYVGEYVAASGLTATFRRDGEKLFAKLGTGSEALLIARTYTRFVDPEKRVFGFQMTGVGPATRATGVILEQGGEKITLEKKQGPQNGPPQGASAQGIALSTAILDRYVGEYKAEAGFTASFRRDGATLFVKPGSNPEAPLAARSETRFQDPRGPVFEFQVDAQGKVTGAILEQQGPQGPQRTPLARK
jgi:aryl-alcohol dehydrogenase-like predicted oxidoreductase